VGGVLKLWVVLGGRFYGQNFITVKGRRKTGGGGNHRGREGRLPGLFWKVLGGISSSDFLRGAPNIIKEVARYEKRRLHSTRGEGEGNFARKKRAHQTGGSRTGWRPKGRGNAFG